MIAEAFAAGNPVVLQFSGGKDSLACLELLRPWWDKLTLMWVNSGDAFPEVAEQARAAGRKCKLYIEIKGDQPQVIRDHGWPVDFLPVWHTSYGRELRPDSGPLFQPAITCCAQSLWKPAQDAIAELAPCTVIRGQRSDERYKGTATSGLVESGVTYLFPLEKWTEREVVEFLQERGVELPESYGWFNSSPDCQHCTAFLEENRGKYAWIAAQHPDLVPELRHRMEKISMAAAEARMRARWAEMEFTYGR